MFTSMQQMSNLTRTYFFTICANRREKRILQAANESLLTHGQMDINNLYTDNRNKYIYQNPGRAHVSQGAQALRNSYYFTVD